MRRVASFSAMPTLRCPKGVSNGGQTVPFKKSKPAERKTLIWEMPRPCAACNCRKQALDLATRASLKSDVSTQTTTKTTGLIQSRMIDRAAQCDGPSVVPRVARGTQTVPRITKAARTVRTQTDDARVRPRTVQADPPNARDALNVASGARKTYATSSTQFSSAALVNSAVQTDRQKAPGQNAVVQTEFPCDTAGWSFLVSEQLSSEREPVPSTTTQSHHTRQIAELLPTEDHRETQSDVKDEDGAHALKENADVPLCMPAFVSPSSTACSSRATLHPSLSTAAVSLASSSRATLSRSSSTMASPPSPPNVTSLSRGAVNDKVGVSTQTPLCASPPHSAPCTASSSTQTSVPCPASSSTQASVLGGTSTSTQTSVQYNASSSTQTATVVLPTTSVRAKNAVTSTLSTAPRQPAAVASTVSTTTNPGPQQTCTAEGLLSPQRTCRPLESASATSLSIANMSTTKRTTISTEVLLKENNELRFEVAALKKQILQGVKAR